MIDRSLFLLLLLGGAMDVLADTRATPAARAEIEKYAGPYPGERFQTLKDIYRGHLEEAGFAAARTVRDIAYGPGERQRLDVLRPDDPADRAMPVLIFVHGGGFVSGERSDGEIFDNVLGYFIRHGVLGINATYGLAPEHGWPSAAEDLAMAVDWVGRNAARYGGDPQKIFLMGHSAGAVHVASYIFMEELQPPGGADGVRGAVLLSGVYGAETAGDAGHPYYGSDAAEATNRAPLAYVDGRAVPLFVIDAEYDPPLMQTSALALISAVCARDGKCPRHQQIAGHNHYSMTYHINTLDDSIARDILHFIGDLSDDRDATD